uniref:VPS9 domain-containing protein n=1 Tax=Amorphochlora amoebiformis TaxID=1561963 RepID=A0A7S0DCF5_9EUKA
MKSFIRRLRAAIKQNRLDQDNRRWQRVRERKKVQEEVSTRRRFMQHELVAVIQKREHAKDTLLDSTEHTTRAKLAVLRRHVSHLSGLDPESPSVPYKYPGVKKIISESRDVARALEREKKALREVREAEIELTEISSQIAKREAADRRLQTVAALKQAREFYKHTPLYARVPEAESVFERLLFDERHPEGKALAKWTKSVEGKGLRGERKKAFSPRIVVEYIRAFIAGFISEHRIPSSLAVPYLQILLERSLIRRLWSVLAPLLNSPRVDLEVIKLKEQIQWLSLLSESEMGIAPPFRKPSEEKRKEANKRKSDASSRPYHNAISCLEESSSLTTPTDILQGMMHCARHIYVTSKSYATIHRAREGHKHTSEPNEVGADYFFPILVYVVTHGDMLSLPRAVRIIRLLGPCNRGGLGSPRAGQGMPKNSGIFPGMFLSSSSEEMYYMTTVEGALHFALTAKPSDFANGSSPLTSRKISSAPSQADSLTQPQTTTLMTSSKTSLPSPSDLPESPDTCLPESSNTCLPESPDTCLPESSNTCRLKSIVSTRSPPGLDESPNMGQQPKDH